MWSDDFGTFSATFYLLSFICRVESGKPLTDDWLLVQLDIFLRGRTGRLLAPLPLRPRIHMLYCSANGFHHP